MLIYLNFSVSLIIKSDSIIHLFITIIHVQFKFGFINTGKLPLNDEIVLRTVTVNVELLI